MMSLTFGLFNQVSDSGPQGPLVSLWHALSKHIVTRVCECMFKESKTAALSNEGLSIMSTVFIRL